MELGHRTSASSTSSTTSAPARSSPRRQRTCSTSAGTPNATSATGSTPHGEWLEDISPLADLPRVHGRSDGELRATGRCPVCSRPPTTPGCGSAVAPSGRRRDRCAWSAPGWRGTRSCIGRTRPSFTFFVHEQALRLQVGSTAVMHEQLLHLVLMAGLPNVTLRVLPASAAERSMFGGPFRLFEYRDHHPLVYLDGPLSGLFLDDPGYVDDYRQLLPALASVALDEGQSRSFAAELADRVRPREPQARCRHLRAGGRAASDQAARATASRWPCAGDGGRGAGLEERRRAHPDAARRPFRQFVCPMP